MGWLYNLFSSDVCSDNIIAIDDKLHFNGEIFSKPFTQSQSIFYKKYVDTDIPMIIKALKENPTEITQILICKRKILNGYGDRTQLVDVIKFLYDRSSLLCRMLFWHMAKADLWKDILVCINYLPKGSEYIPYIVSLFSKQLKVDFTVDSPSKCAIASPMENKKYDKKFSIVKMICNDMNVTCKEYRKNISHLRKKAIENINKPMTPLSCIHNYNETCNVESNIELYWKNCIERSLSHPFISNSIIVLDPEIFTLTAISRRVGILMSLIYSYSKLNQILPIDTKFLTSKTNTFKKYIETLNNVDIINNNVRDQIQYINRSYMNGTQILIISEKNPEESEYLKNMEKIIDSPIIYWLIDDSSIPTKNITLGSVRENNSNFKVQEIAFMNGQEIILMSGSPLIISDVILNCESYKTDDVMDFYLK